MFFASRLACRTACWALGTQKPPTPPPERSGTAETSPAVHTSGTTTPSRCTRRSGWAVIRPRSSCGSPKAFAEGCAMTPAVQISRSVSKVSPVDSSMTPFSALSSWVSRWTSTPRSLVVDHPLSRLAETSGMIRLIASMRWKSPPRDRGVPQRGRTRGCAAPRWSRRPRSRPDDDDVEQAALERAVLEVRRAVEVAHEPVADADGLLDVLHRKRSRRRRGSNVRVTEPAVTTRMSYSSVHGSPSVAWSHLLLRVDLVIRAATMWCA